MFALVAAAIALVPTGRLAIDVRAVGETSAWEAAAIDGLLRADLGDAERVELADVDLARCAGAPKCAVAAARAAEVDLVLLAAVDGGRLRYQLHRTWSASSRLARGEIAIRGIDRSALAYRVVQALEPAIGPGGALDRRDAPRIGAGPATVPTPGLSIAGALVLIALLVVWLASPLALGALLGVQVTRLRSARLAVAIVGGGAAALLAVAVAGDAVAGSGAALWIAGGLTWGWFGVVALRVACPAFGGLERVEHGDVFRLTRAWSLMAIMRLVRGALFYLPLAGVTWLTCSLLDVPTVLMVALIAPLVGLLARFWWLALVEALAAWLDRRLVDGAATADDPWHQATRGYVMGYVRRAGWPVTDQLLDDILFLPGTDRELILYGGGLAPSRIIIGKPLLEMALAPYGRPHDYAEPRISKLEWAEWNSGLVVPLEIGAKIATPEERLPRTGTVPGETEWQPLGQPPTLAYLVEPDVLDRRPAHRPEDDPLWLEWDPGDEHDGTDPNDRDFLFGALVRELGAIRRRDGELATLGQALAIWLAGRPRLLAVGSRLRLLLSRYPTIVGDSFAALNYARHHLIQYLAWRHWGRDELLTARAYAPELERQSTEILRELDREGADKGARGATLRKRLLWLSEFVREPVRSRGTVIVRRLAMTGVALAVAGGIALAAVRAVRYHPTYVERIDEQKRSIEDLQHGQGN